MSAVKKTDRPQFFPGLSVWRSGQGPVLDYGEIVPGDPEHGVQGYQLYLNERELREGVIAWGSGIADSLAEVLDKWGWASPERYRSLEADYQNLAETTNARIAQLEDALERSKTERVQVVSLADVLAQTKAA